MVEVCGRSFNQGKDGKEAKCVRTGSTCYGAELGLVFGLEQHLFHEKGPVPF